MIQDWNLQTLQERQLLWLRSWYPAEETGVPDLFAPFLVSPSEIPNVQELDTDLGRSEIRVTEENLDEITRFLRDVRFVLAFHPTVYEDEFGFVVVF